VSVDNFCTTLDDKLRKREIKNKKVDRGRREQRETDKRRNWKGEERREREKRPKETDREGRETDREVR
jgi:hypothetical protein